MYSREVDPPSSMAALIARALLVVALFAWVAGRIWNMAYMLLKEIERACAKAYSWYKEL